MTDREAALIDHAFANGMHFALTMAAQGAEVKAQAIYERMMLESLHVLRVDGQSGRTE